VSALIVFVDYDNVEINLRGAGPVNLAKVFVSLLPASILRKNAEVTTRLYGGWRSQGVLTTSAQRLLPDIHASSPTYINLPQNGHKVRIRATVELADKPIGMRIPLRNL
jgi:hypothetical protein